MWIVPTHIKNQAEVYRILLMMDAISLKEISEWADSIINIETEYADEFLELSFSEKLGRSESAHKLGQISGDIDNQKVTAEIKAHFRAMWLERKATAEEIAGKLYEASSEGSLLDEFRYKLIELNELVYLVKHGAHYTKADIEIEMWLAIKE